MSRAERQSRVWSYISEHPRCTTEQVMNAINSSIDTAKKDILALRRQGKVVTEVEHASAKHGGMRRSWHFAKAQPLDKGLVMSKQWTPDELGRAL